MFTHLYQLFHIIIILLPNLHCFDVQPFYSIFHNFSLKKSSDSISFYVIFASK